MPEFILRAHAAPVRAGEFLSAVRTEAHVEYLAQVVVNTLFLSQAHRDDTALTLVLERSRDFSRAVRLAGDAIGTIGGLDETSILGAIAGALREAEQLGKEQSIVATSGIEVSTTSFERLVGARLTGSRVCLLDKDGVDIRESAIDQGSVIVLTDHVPLGRKLHRSLIGKGAQPVSLGPVMLHASQCVVLVQNEIDRRTACCAGRRD